MTISDNDTLQHLETLEHSFGQNTGAAAFGATKLSLGVLWHPNRDRIGALSSLHFDQHDVAVISRLTPDFEQPDGSEKAPLLDRHLSRTPLTIKRLSDRVFLLAPPAKKALITVNGRALTRAAEFTLDELGDEIIVSLSNAVVLSLFHAPARARLDARYGNLGLMGVSNAITQVREAIRRSAGHDISVLIRGETGTGKELAARAVHAESGRAQKAMVSVNMAAVAPSLASSELFGVKRGAFTGALSDKPGFFEQAHQGTLFLDEIGDTPQEAQPMLLRALEFGEIRRMGDQHVRKVDVRIVAATDRSLENSAQQTSFNQPLLQRLSGFSIEMAPLRKRRIDIGLLLRAFWLEGGGVKCAEAFDRIRASDVERLSLHDWPGNVRELRNVARQIEIGQPVVACIGPAGVEGEAAEAGRDIDSRISGGGSGRQPYRSRDEVTDQELMDALNSTDWVIKDAASLLNISRTALYDIMTKSPSVRSISQLHEEEIRFTVETVPGGIGEWAKALRVGREALRRRVQNLKRR